VQVDAGPNADADQRLARKRREPTPLDGPLHSLVRRLSALPRSMR